MPNIGAGQILVILLVALVVLGPDKLPGAARTAGRVLREVRQVSSGFQREMREAMDAADIETATTMDNNSTSVDDTSTTMDDTTTSKPKRSGLHPGLGPGPSLPPAVAEGAKSADEHTPQIRSDGPSASFS